MAKSVEQLNQQIAKLQQQIEIVKAKEASGVIERIREAIDHYGLTPEQLFGPRSARSAGAKEKNEAGRGNGKRNEQTPKTAPEQSRKRSSPFAGVKLAPKFADGQGNTWTGRGTTPRWLAEAIASGKTKEEFALKR